MIRDDYLPSDILLFKVLNIKNSSIIRNLDEISDSQIENANENYAVTLEILDSNMSSLSGNVDENKVKKMQWRSQI